MSEPTTAPSDTIVLIHGSCSRALSHWVTRYSARGYRVIAAGVPLATVCEDAVDPDRKVVAAAAEFYERLLMTVPTPPILVGHCFGGLVTQSLLNRGLGTVGVAISTPSMLPQRARQRGQAPLLFVGGGLDRKVDAESVERAAERRQKSGAVTGYLEYPDACHHSMHAPGWELVADDVLDWAELYTDRRVVTPG